MKMFPICCNRERIVYLPNKMIKIRKEAFEPHTKGSLCTPKAENHMFVLLGWLAVDFYKEDGDCLRWRVSRWFSLVSPFFWLKERKGVVCVGLVCLDLVTVVDHFPKEDTDMRSSAQYKVSQSGMSAIDIFLKVRGGNANNSCRVLAELGFPATFLGSLAGQVHTSYLSIASIALLDRWRQINQLIEQERL